MTEVLSDDELRAAAASCEKVTPNYAGWVSDQSLLWFRSIERVVLAKLAEKQEPVVIEQPDYHSEAMGCGLEDRNIRDRYEAMAYGWQCGVDKVFEQVPDEPLYTHPAPAQPVDEAAVQEVLEFDEGQWWVEELDALLINGTPDQMRAVAVVHNLIGLIRKLAGSGT